MFKTAVGGIYTILLVTFTGFFFLSNAIHVWKGEVESLHQERRYVTADERLFVPGQVGFNIAVGLDHAAANLSKSIGEWQFSLVRVI